MTLLSLLSIYDIDTCQDLAASRFCTKLQKILHQVTNSHFFNLVTIAVLIHVTLRLMSLSINVPFTLLFIKVFTQLQFNLEIAKGTERVI